MAKLVPVEESKKAARLVPVHESKGGFNVEALTDTLRDLPRYGGMAAKSVAQGLLDPVVGAGQLVAETAGVLGAEGFRDRYRNYMGQREEDYRASRAGYENQPDLARVAGNLIPGIGMSAGAVAPSMLGRMFQGAKLGSIAGATSFVEPGAEDFWYRKTGQAAFGAGAGFIAPAVMEGVIRGTGATVNAMANKLKGFAKTASPQKIESTLKVEFQRSGVDWAKLPQAVRDEVLSVTQQALKGGGTLDNAAIQRLAAFQKLQIEPTAGQVSRDPAQFALERNLAKMEIGTPLTERFVKQNAQLIASLDQVRSGTGAAGVDPYSSGRRVVSALQAKDAARKAAVDRAYAIARESAGLETDVPMQPIVQKMGQIAEDFGDDRIPSAVMKRLNEFGAKDGTQTKVFNIREAEKLKTLIDNNVDAPGTPTAKALSQLKNSVDDAIGSLADTSVIPEAATAFKGARSLAAKRFKAIEANPALSQAISKTGAPVAPETFVESYVVRGDIGEVARLMRELPVSARREARAAVIDWVRTKAVPASGGDTAQLTQSGLNKALASIGDRKLKLIFAGDREGEQMLRAIGDVASYVQKAPVSSGVNTSSSATTVLDAMDRATRFPIIGPFLGKPSDIIRASQVTSALGPVAPTTPPGLLIPKEWLDPVAKRSGLLFAPAAGLLPFALSR